MCLITALLPTIIDIAIAAARRLLPSRFWVRLLLGFEALQARPRRQQGTIDREMIIREQALLVRMSHHLREELVCDVHLEQPLTVMRKGRRNPYLVVHLQSNE